MAQTIDLMGASYPDVPAVNLPKHGGGTAKFTDVTDTTAAASDVAQGKYFYTADGTRTEGTSSGGGGIPCPPGYAYYNGILLPQIPVEEGYDYAWIRTNADAGVYNVVYGKSQWRTRSSATLDNWQLEFATLSSDGAVYYKIADDGSETAWHDRMTSTNYFGLSTSLGRKVIWSSHDIRISTTSNVVMYGAPVLYPPSS